MDQPADPRAKAPTQPQMPASTPAKARELRLAAALKANIGRRKAQAGSRAKGDGDDNDNSETA